MDNNIGISKGWLISIILAGLVAAAVSKFWLFSQAACPNLQDGILYVSTAIIVLGMCARAVFNPLAAPLDKFKTIAIVLAVVLIVPPVAGTVLAQFPTVREQYCATCDELLKGADELFEEGKNPNSPNRRGNLSSAELFIRRCIDRKEALSGKEAGTRLAYVLEARATLLTQEVKCQEARADFKEAHSLSEQYGLSDLKRVIELGQEKLERACAIPTPVPTPTYTPTPTRTPTPTNTPTNTPTSTPTRTPTPRPTPIAGLYPCSPPTGQPIATFRLSVFIPSPSPAPVARGVFYDKVLQIPYQFTGKEYVCLSSTPDGKGKLQVDDRVLVEVEHGDGSAPASWFFDFYDRGVISPIDPRDATIMFTPGRNTVRIELRDQFPNVYSAYEIWIVIWMK